MNQKDCSDIHLQKLKKKGRRFTKTTKDTNINAPTEICKIYQISKP